MSIAISGSSITFSDQTQMSTAAGGSFRNRIINGDMRIDQRNAGASVTPANSFTLDRWIVENSQASKLTVQQNAGSVTPPIGFSQYLGVTSTATTTVSAGDYFMLEQRIEGYNVADLNWGTVNAKTVTVSFWVRSSLTGTFGGSVMNGLNARAYPFTYTISVADTWEYKTITIAGDTSGTWNTTNGNGMFLNFGLGMGSTYSGTAGAWTAGNLFSATGAVSVVGTNGATFYITGVQLEQGSTATDFERRPIGTELALCQRYYEILTADTEGVAITSFLYTGTHSRARWFFKTTKRTIPPTVGLQSGSWINVTPTIYRSADSVGFSNTSGNFASNTTLFADAEL